MKRVKAWLVIFAIPFSVLLFSGGHQAQAADQVTAIKGKNVLIKFTKSKPRVGDIYSIYTKKKYTGRIRITKVRGSSARGKLMSKSGARKGSLVKIRKRAKQKKKVAKKKKWKKQKRQSRPMGNPKGTMYLGGLVGYGANSMTVTLDNADEVALSGSGFSAKALIDYKLFSMIWFRGAFGLESFNVAGEENLACGDGLAPAEDCEVSINYMSLDVLGRFVFSSSSIRPWAGAGVNLLIPSSNETTALDSESISTTSVLVGAGGIDWFASPTLMIPLQIEYGIYPASEKVKASYFALRTGVAFEF